MPLRFPNPGSDISRMLNSYRLIHRELGGAPFDLDAISEVLTRYFQASSSGAVGADALARSQNDDSAGPAVQPIEDV